MVNVRLNCASSISGEGSHAQQGMARGNRCKKDPGRGGALNWSGIIVGLRERTVEVKLILICAGTSHIEQYI